MKRITDRQLSTIDCNDLPLLPGKHTMWMDICSLVVMGDAAKSERVLEWLDETLEHPWHWGVRHRHVGRLTGLTDVRLELWVSFDNAEEAMLVKLTWLDFRNPEYATD